jgi:hypothetical protein
LGSGDGRSLPYLKLTHYPGLTLEQKANYVPPSFFLGGIYASRVDGRSRSFGVDQSVSGDHCNLGPAFQQYLSPPARLGKTGMNPVFPLVAIDRQGGLPHHRPDEES